MRSSLPPIDGISLRTPAKPSDTHLSIYPGLAELQDADTMSEGGGWAWGFVFAGIIAMICAGGVAIIAGVVWFVVKVIESFV